MSPHLPHNFARLVPILTLFLELRTMKFPQKPFLLLEDTIRFPTQILLAMAIGPPLPVVHTLPRVPTETRAILVKLLLAQTPLSLGLLHPLANIGLNLLYVARSSRSVVVNTPTSPTRTQSKHLIHNRHWLHRNILD